MTDDHLPEKLVMYGNEFCPDVAPVRSVLARAGVDYQYISISRDRAARWRVMEINGGNASVPTLVFPDGGTMTEPTLAELTARLETEGRAVPAATFAQRSLVVLSTPSIWAFGAMFLAGGLFTDQHSLTVAGAILLIVALLARLGGWLLMRRI